MPAEPAPTPEEIQLRRQEIKSKIIAVGKMQKVFQMLRFVLFLPSGWPDLLRFVW